MYVTTEFRPSPSFLQPTSKPKGVAAGRNPNSFVFGRSQGVKTYPPRVHKAVHGERDGRTKEVCYVIYGTWLGPGISLGWSSQLEERR